jgi:hypothetical protein
MPPIGVLAARQVSIEFWARRINNGVMDPDFPYAWHVLPLVRNLRPGARQFGAARQANIFTGQGYENLLWGDGPTNDWPAASDRVHQWVEAVEAELPATLGPVPVIAS